MICHNEFTFKYVFELTTIQKPFGSSGWLFCHSQ